jgi:hypothetical protein
MHLGLKRLSAALVFGGASFMPGWAREAAFTCPAGFIPKEGLKVLLQLCAADLVG